MGLRTVGRMIIAPAGAGIAVGIILRPLGSVALPLAVAAFLSVQLTAAAQSRRQLEAAKRRLASIRARRQRLRPRPDG